MDLDEGNEKSQVIMLQDRNQRNSSPDFRPHRGCGWGFLSCEKTSHEAAHVRLQPNVHRARLYGTLYATRQGQGSEYFHMNYAMLGMY